MTTKLYWNDSYLKQFSARVEETWLQDGDRIVVLDQSAFYPTGGGQPGDHGRINSVPVIEVEIDDDQRIRHRLAGAAALAAGAEIEGEIDWPRRRELMQQHTGQHLLSQAFFQLFGAETRGFRITDQTTEIDLDLEVRPEELEAAVIRAEEMANEIVFENREIRFHLLTPEAAARLPLRKESFITDCVRVIEIADYDWSPCGGTHFGRTGEVGIIATRGWERAKKMTRLSFVCGVRALRDYRAANRTADAIAQKFSVGRDDAELSVARMLDENKRLSRRVRELAEVAARVEAQELIEGAAAVNGLRIVSRIFDDRELDGLKLIAHRLVESDGVIALLAARENGMARLVFASSTGVPADMGAWMKVACERLGGRGGGKPDFAQGGGPQIDRLNEVMEFVLRNLEKSREVR
ncbi:MAG TPA: DHHA1 domain-containing protein [Blastocatellia bacterium]|nr:DHHA1 domain-containing protein [Blastocatellia bacterium]